MRGITWPDVSLDATGVRQQGPGGYHAEGRMAYVGTDRARPGAVWRRQAGRQTWLDVRNGWQIGSGPVESACKTVVGNRLKGGGMRWGNGRVQMPSATSAPSTLANPSVGNPSGIHPPTDTTYKLDAHTRYSWLL